MYQRTLEKIIREKVGSVKAIIVLGARQVGKTTLMNTILQEKDLLFLDADDPTIRPLLTNPKTKLAETFVNTYNAEAKIIDRTNFREFVVINNN